jgi:hypothetical protein
MVFDDNFDELDRMLIARSTDYEEMRKALQKIRQVQEIARMLGPAQDNLYASIARGHRKALVHLEAGDTEAAKKEMAGAVSWFLRRFQGCKLDSFPDLPKVADEMRASRELADRSEVLRDALSKNHDIHAD